MPRDGAGVYTLPAGNPVVTNTVIASTWANTTLSDIAAQLNNVITRDGLLGPTGPFKIVDGTVNAPGLAYNSEPGAGWFRKGTSDIVMAFQGSQVFGFAASSAVLTNFTILPRAVGASAFTMCSDPAGTVNTNNFSIIKQASEVQFLAAGVGTGTPANFMFSAAGVTFKNPILAGYTVINLVKGAPTTGALVQGMAVNGFPRWNIYLAGNEEELGANTGSNFSINRYTDGGAHIGAPVVINRASGLVTLTATNVTGILTASSTLDANGAANFRGPVTIYNGTGISLQQGGAGYVSQLVQYVPDGRLVLARTDSNWSDGSLTLRSGSIELICAGGSFLRYAPGGGGGLSIQGLATTTEAVSATLRWNGVDAHVLAVFVSARRFKKGFQPVPDGAMSLVRKLKPLSYLSAIEGDTTDRIPGFVAEDFVDAGAHDYVIYQEGQVQSLRYDRVPVLLTKALQELDQRITQLENA